ncbi:MAG TPA: PQQ-binding-like beta-propeller repeat protein, partial [Verrucomicrobiae bacterium]
MKNFSASARRWFTAPLCAGLLASLALWPAGAAHWPMFRGGPALLGEAQGGLGKELSPLWTFKTAGPVKSSAAIDQGRVVVGSGDGNVYALDFVTGKKMWAYKTEGPVESSPLILEGKVFVGSVDASLHAIDAVSG